MYWIPSFLLFQDVFATEFLAWATRSNAVGELQDTIRDHGSEPEAFSEQVLLSRQTVGVPGGIPRVLFGKKTGGLEDGVGGGWRKRSMSLKGNVGHLLQHWGAGNSYFLKVIRCNFDPSRTLEKIPAGRSKAFFRWAGIKTRVNFHDYIWITTNHCKDPY